MLASTSALSSGLLASAAPAPRTLSDLDERLVSGRLEVLVARAPHGIVDALLAHAARSAKRAKVPSGQPGQARLTIVARAHAGAPLWQEVALRLAIPHLALEPAACAEQIAAAALLRKAMIFAPLPAEGSWDRAVAAELSSRDSVPLVLFVAASEDGETADDIRGDRFDVAPQLDSDEKHRWWSAIADEAHALVGSDDLAQLDAWWAAIKRAPAATESFAKEAPEGCRAMFTALALADRPWAVAELAALSTDDALPRLLAAGMVCKAGGWLTIAPSWEAHAKVVAERASGAERARVAEILATGPGAEPWAFARASELLAREATDVATLEAADRAHARALSAIDESLARREIVARWIGVVEALPPEPRRELLLRTAERALAAGEPDEAARCLQGASTGSEDGRVLLLQGRASAALGDMVAARVALDRAQRLAGAGQSAEATELSALAVIELAEVAYMTGDVATARQHAQTGIALTSSGSTVLKGRNVLGKLLLAESKWDEADSHFAEDGMLAAEQKDGTAELRARLNRGIALLSKGLPEEARVLFQSVLAEGERRNEARACAYALSNLGHLALQRHEYGASLEYWERAIKLLHAMRDRMAAARILANLAALRHILGLFDHAEHALSFGRRILGAGITSGRASHFDVVAARIALTRGHTIDARREIEAAILKSATDTDLLGEAHRVGARIALEDGDLPRAQQMLVRARELATKDMAHAEIALLQAHYERASGNCGVEAAKKALALARTAGEENLLRETHVLLAELYRVDGDTDAARTHLEQAAQLRDKVADRIPSDLRGAYLAKPDIAHLAKLQAQLAEPVSRQELTEEDAPRSVRAARPATSTPREIVGDDPAIRGLLQAIRKVARSTSTVLIRGESGTGKELVAEALHRGSDRSGGPLVTVNCAALVETLLLSELFGHEKGSFTGAFARRRGRFELAEGGTLFLDEIGDISARTQVALLRVLQERTFERVGGTTAIRANVRIVCATHRDLRAMVERGDFREDLYYRLRGITLEVPALRARLGDLPRISEHLLARIATERGEQPKTLSPDAIELLGRHRWPGNVRELENALRVASLFAESDAIGASDFVENVDDLRRLAGSSGQTGPNHASPNHASHGVPASLQATLPAASALVARDVAPDAETTVCDTDESLESDAPLPQIEANATSVAYAQVRQGSVSLSDMKRQIERDCIARALAETKGNITRAASILGMKRPRLSQLVKQYGLAAVSSEGSG
ncbi:MAG: sigma 54-interacting transcriptional regulator [Polyangiaceae bacterium]